MISSPPDFALRPVRPDDAEAVLALIGPELHFGLDDIRNEWRSVDLGRDTWAWEHGGRLAAFGILRSRGEELSVDGFVHPDFRGRGLGTAILQATEGRARERGAWKLANGILATDHAAAALLEANGYRDVRHYFVMTIELDEAPPAPEWPKGLEPRPFEREHARAFWPPTTRRSRTRAATSRSRSRSSWDGGSRARASIRGSGRRSGTATRSRRR